MQRDVAALKDTGYFDEVRTETTDEFGTSGEKIVAFYVREKNGSEASRTPASPPTLLQDEVSEQYKQASEHLWAGELEDAQRAFDAVLHNRPDFSSAKTLLGLTFARLSAQSENLGETTLAVAQLREALAQDPQEAYWHEGLAKLLHAQGKAEEAVAECAQAARLSSDDSDLAWGCGFGASPEIENDSTIPYWKDLAGAGDSTEPIPQNHPNPDYSEKARRARLQGSLVMWVVVGIHGDVEQAAIAESLGLGLDENALRTVRTWTFRPAALDGTPIPVRTKVEMSFRLF